MTNPPDLRVVAPTAQPTGRQAMKPMGRLEAWYAKRVGYAIVRLFRMAEKRSDTHEMRHAHAAVLAGNSDPCRDGMCHLDREALERWLRS